MTESAHLLVFDSGVGALSVIREIKSALPHCSITYASDNAYFPYGDKPEHALIARVDKVLTFLHSEVRPNIIVVACNTASTVALPKIRNHFSTPTVGVVPAIRPAALQTQSGVIGLLATPGTVTRTYTQNLIEEFASHCQVISVGSSELVEQAERKLRGLHTDSAVIQGVMAKVFESENGHRVDTIVLGCTHFPLLKEELKLAASRPLQWVDSGPAIARRVEYWIKETRLSQQDQPNYRTIFTASETRSLAFNQAISSILPGPIDTLSAP